MGSISCPSCNHYLPLDKIHATTPDKCPSCSTLFELSLFPAALNDLEKGQKAETIITDTDASCFFHEDKVAVATCDGCGIYLCSLCELDLGTGHFCSACFSKKQDNSVEFQKSVTFIDQILLSVSLLSCFFMFFTVVTAPVILFMCFWKWNSVKTPYKRGKWRFVLAGCIALLQILGIATFFIALMLNNNTGVS